MATAPAPPAPAKAAPPPPPPASATASPSAAQVQLPRVTLTRKPAEFQAPKIVLNAVEGWGKSSAGAFSPSPAFLMASGERGYETLLGAGLVPNVPRATIPGWLDLLGAVKGIADEPGDIKTIVLDAMGGLERLCQEYVCQRDYSGDWSEKGFNSFKEGYGVAANEWIDLLALLERANIRGISILLLSHSKTATFYDPMGKNFDRYGVDVHHKVWSNTARWADAVLFGKFLTVVDTGKNKSADKGKGIGGAERVIYTENRDAYIAKNRYKMPPMISIPNDPSKIWSTIYGWIVASKNTATQG